MNEETYNTTTTLEYMGFAGVTGASLAIVAFGKPQKQYIGWIGLALGLGFAVWLDTRPGGWLA